MEPVGDCYYEPLTHLPLQQNTPAIAPALSFLAQLTLNPTKLLYINPELLIIMADHTGLPRPVYEQPRSLQSALNPPNNTFATPLCGVLHFAQPGIPQTAKDQPGSLWIIFEAKDRP